MATTKERGNGGPTWPGTAGGVNAPQPEVGTGADTDHAEFLEGAVGGVEHLSQEYDHECESGHTWAVVPA